MSANISEAKIAAAEATAAATPSAPKRITNAQTVCNERNEKNKLCNGHLKQLKTAGELSEVHLRGDDVLSKCHLCGTLYMGPPLGHVRDPEKQSRFVEAELSALLQAAGGTLPVIEKNEKGVYVIVEPGGSGHGKAAPVPTPGAKPAPAAATQAAAPKPTPVSTPAVAAPTGPKPAAAADRTLFKRSTYAGVVDTGPVPGETREQKIARLQQVVVGAKQRSDEGGAEHAPAAAPVAAATVPEPAESVTQPATATATEATTAPKAAAPPATSHASSGEPDRTLFRRSTYAGVADTGPAPGETHEQKIERLTKLAAAAKQKSEEGG
jgi:hypothetical protein